MFKKLEKDICEDGIMLNGKLIKFGCKNHR